MTAQADELRQTLVDEWLRTWSKSTTMMKSHEPMRSSVEKITCSVSSAVLLPVAFPVPLRVVLAVPTVPTVLTVTV